MSLFEYQRGNFNFLLFSNIEIKENIQKVIALTLTEVMMGHLPPSQTHK